MSKQDPYKHVRELLGQADKYPRSSEDKHAESDDEPAAEAADSA